ncbi:hypothetical protein WOLCODRAFT_19141 [Wolfiporia cocos MD-104 SS10]|uniref:Uncharacterized protein n=1 Tax=Wolfiporia cocos (strain MD-104) TaxID=742152 RepID=A0A2H3JRI2_WOLCO|nr:hypothetical protein WOLCODRAFT_19141 [Wolfiporia cocos MD-104 SS10]
MAWTLLTSPALNGDVLQPMEFQTSIRFRSRVVGNIGAPLQFGDCDIDDDVDLSTETDVHGDRYGKDKKTWKSRSAPVVLSGTGDVGHGILTQHVPNSYYNSPCLQLQEIPYVE